MYLLTVMKYPYPGLSDPYVVFTHDGEVVAPGMVLRNGDGYVQVISVSNIDVGYLINNDGRGEPQKP